MARTRETRTKLVATMGRLLRDQGYTSTGRVQLLAESGVSNGSLYHHFPGGMEELAEAALEASGRAVADQLARALDEAPSTAQGVVRFLEVAEASAVDGQGAGCPIAPTALESPLVSPRLRAAAARWFDEWEELIAARLRADAWPADSASATAPAALALVEGALLLARVSGRLSHLAHARAAALTLLAEAPSPSAPDGR